MNLITIAWLRLNFDTFCIYYLVQMKIPLIINLHIQGNINNAQQTIIAVVFRLLLYISNYFYCGIKYL